MDAAGLHPGVPGRAAVGGSQGGGMRGDFEMGGTPIADALRAEPQRLPKMNGPVRLADGTVITPKEGVKFDQGKRRVDLVPTEAINALLRLSVQNMDHFG